MDQRTRLKKIVESHLDLAEEAWAQCGDQLLLKASLNDFTAFADAMETEIPGHSVINDNEFIVDEFLAFVVDMRDSSKHLLQEISRRKTKISMLQRVFYEVSALLPVAADLLYSEGGRVTEYLGDGLLGLFKVEGDGHTACYSAWHVGRDVIGVGRDVVNEALGDRYNIPAVDLGVGLAVSKAIITGFGHANYRQPKVIGECVYRATKLSGARNKVVVDSRLKAIWPKSKNGALGFSLRNLRGIDGYIINFDG